MTMTLAQGTSMNSLKKADRMDNTHCRTTLPTSYAALVGDNGEEVEITDAQILRALDAVESQQQFPYGSRHTARGRWVAAKAPVRTLHS